MFFLLCTVLFIKVKTQAYARLSQRMNSDILYDAGKVWEWSCVLLNTVPAAVVPTKWQLGMLEVGLFMAQNPTCRCLPRTYPRSRR